MQRRFDIAESIPPGAGLRELKALVEDDVVDGEDFDGLGSREGESGAVDLEFERGPEIPRIRPILVALSARAMGQDRADQDLQRTAEMLHAALVVHDLALGREGGKRRRVARRLMKKSVSWLNGNHLTLRALEIASASRPEVLAELLHTLRDFADGHALMEELQEGRVPTVDDWQEHTDTHTGALFAFCCRIGARGPNREGDRIERARVEALARYGRHLGRVWHIAEDLHLFTDEGCFEQEVVARALAGRPMLPVAIAANRSPAVGRLWAQLVQHPSGATADWLATLVTEAGGLAGARERLVTESWHARRALSVLPESSYRNALTKLASSLARASTPSSSTSSASTLS